MKVTVTPDVPVPVPPLRFRIRNNGSGTARILEIRNETTGEWKQLNIEVKPGESVMVDL